jgi:hypothetical protein
MARARRPQLLVPQQAVQRSADGQAYAGDRQDAARAAAPVNVGEVIAHHT